MTSTYSTNLSLQLQGNNDNPGSWGANLNANVFTLVDNALGSTYAPSVAGSSDVTLTVSQAGNLIHNLTGVLTGNINYIFPVGTSGSTSGRLLIIKNATSGAFTLTVKPTGGTGVAVTQGTTQLIYIDSSNATAYQPISISNLGGLAKASNLSDVASASTSLTNLGGLSSSTAASTYAPINSPTFTTGISFNPTTGGITGTTTNDSASSGFVGEYIESIISSGSAISISSATSKTVTSISLTAGDWDVTGNVFFAPNASTVTTQAFAAISTTNNTLPTAPAGGFSAWSGSSTTTTPYLTVGTVRASLSGTTTYYLVAQATFTTSTNAIYGIIRARRIR